ncbi:ATP-binding protein [Marinomonas sp.]|uniref:ATP-binding protein n=1 Tax=Marinomonas sp. TaxID=1904862 RepID=UPI003BAC0829
MNNLLIQHINADLAWCQARIHSRLDEMFQSQETQSQETQSLIAPYLAPNTCQYTALIEQFRLTEEARLAVCLALIPILSPSLFEVLLQPNEHTQRPFIEFGLVESEGSILATGHTLAFLLGGNPAQQRLDVLTLLSKSSDAALSPLFDFDKSVGSVPLIGQSLKLHNDVYQRLLLLDDQYSISGSSLASPLTTSLTWHDLVLPEEVHSELNEIDLWLDHGEALNKEWQLEGKLRPGFRALFYGPPGTGKTLTATLLGKRTQRPVYRVDIGAITSKYIGETEKNLEQVFILAEKHHWLLFFDEADALFGKRVQTAGANDQFANQNVAYLLQRIEAFSGMIILATNLENNLDDAFFRRFEATVYFPKPDERVRLALWKNAIPDASKLANDVDLNLLAKRHPLSGAEIINIVRYAALKAMSKHTHRLALEDIQTAINKTQRTQPNNMEHAGSHTFF